MVDLNYKIRILFFILSMILSVSALEISFLNVLTDFKCKTNILFINNDGKKKYDGTNLQPINFLPTKESSIVILHIVDEKRYEDIAKPKAATERSTLAEKLIKNNYELIVLGIGNCQVDEFGFIDKIIYDIIHPNQKAQVLITEEPVKSWGWKTKHSWKTELPQKLPFKIFKGANLDIFGGTLEKYLTDKFPKMEYKSKRSDKTKEIKSYESKIHRKTCGVRDIDPVSAWPFSVENGEYVPDVKDHRFIVSPFLKRINPNEIFHILIVNGNEYYRIKMDDGLMREFDEISNKMFKKNETLVLMGCYNFDWSEMDVVHQIILKHSERFATTGGENKVFTIGIGMFRTFCENPITRYANRIPPTRNEMVKQFAEKCNFRTDSELRTLEIYDFNAKPVSNQPKIISFNDRYVPQRGSEKYSFSKQYPNKEFVFIAMNSSEVDNPKFSVSSLNEYAQRINQNNDTVIFLIKASNLKLYDLHIIPEWVELHRGGAHPNRITILGGGSFNTHYQYFSPFYQVFYTRFMETKKLNELQQFFINPPKEKDLFVFYVGLDKSNFKTFEIRKYPMHTINGFYDPVVLSNDDMIFTGEQTQYLFHIINAEKFNDNAGPSIHAYEMIQLENRITGFSSRWDFFCVGLRNFGTDDSHLFPEFVKIHRIADNRFWVLSHTYCEGNRQTRYVYKDDNNFSIITSDSLSNSFKSFGETFTTVYPYIKGL